LINDSELIRQILSGNNKAFEELINQNQRLVAHIVYRFFPNRTDNEEICQEIFLKVYYNLKGFKFQSKLSTWIGKITFNICMNYARKQKLSLLNDLVQTNNPSESINFEIDSNEDTPDVIVENKDMSEIIGKIMQYVPIQYRTVLTMYHLDQLSYKEISEIMDLPEGTIKSYIFRGRKLLKEKIIAEYQGEKIWE
jgi:RNA polymerase sigma factor (sigma-70 family)